MPEGKYTIAIRKDGTCYKVSKVWFGSDGSYYVTVPYHSAKKALLAKQTVNFSTSISGAMYPLSDALEVASADEKRIKLSHHPDGFTQFSGTGVTSGKTPDGEPKGIGIQSWPFKQGCRGPVFGVTLFGINEFESEVEIGYESCIFDEQQMTSVPGATGFVLEGYYFPPHWRRFIRQASGGNKGISIVHPSGGVLPLRVLLPNDKCPIGGFLGVELTKIPVFFEDVRSGYIMSSSTGNVRVNEKKELIGDALFCMYPRLDDSQVRRTVDYDNKRDPPYRVDGQGNIV